MDPATYRSRALAFPSFVPPSFTTRRWSAEYVLEPSSRLVLRANGVRGSLCSHGYVFSVFGLSGLREHLPRERTGQNNNRNSLNEKRCDKEVRP